MDKGVIIRKIAVYAVFILLFTCFQVSFPDRLSFNGQIADLMFVFTALVAYMFGFWDGLVVGLITGILRDSFAAPAVSNLSGQTVTSVGIGALVLFLTALFSSSVFTIRMHRKFTFAILTVVVATILYKLIGHLTIYIWIRIFSDSAYGLSFKQLVVDSVLTQLLLNTVCAIPLYFILKYIGPYRKGMNPAFGDNTRKGGYSSWLTI